MSQTVSGREELLDTKEVAKRIGITDIALVVMRREGRGPRWLRAKDAKIVLYHWGDVLDWFEEGIP